MQGEQVEILVGELRFHMPRCAAKKTFFLMNQGKMVGNDTEENACMYACCRKKDGREDYICGLWNSIIYSRPKNSEGEGRQGDRQYYVAEVPEGHRSEGIIHCSGLC